jgi:hypothetical protein
MIYIGIDNRQWKQYYKYWVCEDGEVFRKKTLKPFLDKDGYLRISLSFLGSGRQTKIHVHRLVYKVWRDEIPKDMVCCHIDSNILNNHYSNLRVDTQKNNIRDKLKNGTWQAGNSHPNTIYQDDDIVKIQDAIRDNAEMKLKQLENLLYPLPRHLIFDVKRGKRKTRQQRIQDAESIFL